MKITRTIEDRIIIWTRKAMRFAANVDRCETFGSGHIDYWLKMLRIAEAEIAKLTEELEAASCS